MSRYIDADATIRAICGTKCGRKRDECGYEIPCQQVQMIEATPTADVRENVRGEWIIVVDNTSFVKQVPRKWVECSRCRWSFSYDRIKDNYCSHCGADMRKGEEKEVDNG